MVVAPSLKADADAEYAVTEIDLADIKEPIPLARTIRTTSKFLSEVAGDKIDEGVHRFLHDQHRPLPCRFQAAGRQERHPTRLWIARRPRWMRIS